MQRLVGVFILIFSASVWAQEDAPAASARWHTSLGFGVESRLKREINPEFSQIQNIPRLYSLIRYYPYGLSVELAQLENSSRVGGFEVNTVTTELSIWGRYEFSQSRPWVPFVALGAASSFDRVTSKFGGSQDERDGLRTSLGVSAGISGTLWSMVQLEGEGRAVVDQDRKDPQLSALIKVGFHLL